MSIAICERGSLGGRAALSCVGRALARGAPAAALWLALSGSGLAQSTFPLLNFLQRDLETGIFSASDLFISLRYMRHVWIAGPDETQLAVVQKGDFEDDGLVLYKTLDGGEHWTLEGDDLLASPDLISDGVMLPDKSLLLVASCFSRGVIADVTFLRLNQDPDLQQWSVDPSTPATVFDSITNVRASRATLAIDSNGTLWCAFRLQSEGTFKIRLYYSLDGGLLWLDSGNELGTPNPLEHKGAKVVAAGSRIAVIYQDIQPDPLNPLIPKRFKGWAYREDFQAPDDPMPAAILAQMDANDSDPNGTHWSVAADHAGNLHLTYQDGQIRYLRYDAAAGTWSSPDFLGTLLGNYNSISAADNGDLYVFAHLDGTSKIALKRFSLASGSWSSWVPVSLEPHQGTLRMSSPERFEDHLPLLYEVSGGGNDRLLYCLLGPDT